jgi:hypothetical protein
MPVEERERLLSMGGIIGRVQITGDARGSALEPLPMVRNDGRSQRAPHPRQGPRTGRGFKPRQGRLRGQGGASHWIPSHRQFVPRIVGQPGGVVAIRIATRQANEPLPQQVADRVPDFLRVPAIDQATGQLIGQVEAVIHRLEQHHAAIGTGVALVEPSDHRLEFVVAFEGDLR